MVRYYTYCFFLRLNILTFLPSIWYLITISETPVIILKYISLKYILMNIYKFHYQLLPNMFLSLNKACNLIEKLSLATYSAITNNFF